MLFILAKRLITNHRLFMVVSVAAILVVVAGGLFYAWQRAASSSVSGETPETATPLDLGITYLPLTPRLAAYYGLDVDAGALVTEVIPGSPADRAGVKAGDVIISFNGVRVGREEPLLGMMQVCAGGSRFELEMRTGNSVRTVEFIHRGN